VTSHLLRIAIPAFKSDKRQNYTRWLETHQPDIEWVTFAPGSHVFTLIAQCHGLLLPGGRDVHPRHYGLAEKAGSCHLEEERDGIELRAIEAAFEMNLPVLGICRGLQIVNVALGGSLIIDLPQAGIRGHGKIADSDSCHPVTIVPDSLLSDASTAEEVNSSHHQAVDQPAHDLRVTAHAPDGVVEAMEWKEATGKGFLLLVQWHPERLEPRSSLAYFPAHLFLDAATTFQRGSFSVLR